MTSSLQDAILLPNDVILLSVPGYQGYWAGSDGCIYSSHRRGPSLGDNFPPKRLASRSAKGGYLKLTCVWYENGRRFKRDRYVHRLVCMAWHGPQPRKSSEVRHLNNRPMCNTPSNLRWGSRNLQFQDMAKNGSTRFDGRSARAARKMLIEGVSIAQVARVFSIAYETARYLAQGLSWRRYEYGLTPEFRQWQRQNLTREASRA